MRKYVMPWVDANPGMKPASVVWAFKTDTGSGGAKFLLVTICMFADPSSGEWVRDDEDFRADCRLGKHAYKTAIGKLTDLGLVTRQRLESGKIRFFLPKAPRGLVPEFDENGESFGWGGQS